MAAPKIVLMLFLANFPIQALNYDQSIDNSIMARFRQAESLLHKSASHLNGKTFLCVGPLCIQSGLRSYFIGVGCGLGIGAGAGFPISGSGQAEAFIL